MKKYDMKSIFCTECKKIFDIESGVGIVTVLCPYCGSEKVTDELPIKEEK